MAEAALRAGRCLCGAARFAARPATGEVDVCHCGMCRRWAGGVFMAAACDDVALADEAAFGVYRSSEYGERLFCRTCGSSLIWRMQDGSSAHVAVSAFDDPAGFVFAKEIFIDDKPAFYDFANDTRRLTAAEFMAEMEKRQEAGHG
ncbi:GFA family protein [Hansschlegelia beijingensis]|uniref:CENP-V/GFA domain-containing protein n=1 Tax=Hansschlegelia beijingensis TaxID=1133344 RepID=A0A7W6D739_9HYPH|nr:GFA family protein [Hansschlegelia beijingensis]MBB3974383.1 hypothetical protein [Hansschlegelia beijingensis]